MYMVKKLNKLHLPNIFASDRLKKFHLWQPLYLDYVFSFHYKELLNLDNFLLNNGNSNLFDISKDWSNLEYS